MRCNAVRNKLDRLSRKELAPRMRERVEAHLKDCAACPSNTETNNELETAGRTPGRTGTTG
ncbi:MAG: zf-HC2 domain-containing protein [Thermoguttaceae bacterium]